MPDDADSDNDDTADAPANGDRGDGKEWVFDQFRSDPFQFLLVTIFVFIVAAIVVVLIFSVVFERQPWQFQGSVRTLLALAGASLITIFLSRSRTTLNSTIGIVLIGALIISTEDILRLSLLFSGSDRSFEEFYLREAPRTASQQAQNSNEKEEVDISTLIVNRLSAEALIDSQPRTESRVAAVISQFLRLERNSRLLSQLEQRAADRLFRAIVDGSFQEWNFRFGNQQKFQSDLAFLRSIGLVSYVYGTPQETIEVTDLGRELSVHINSPVAVDVSDEPEIQRISVGTGATSEFNVDPDGSWFVFDIDRAENIEINVTSQFVDPVARLYTSLNGSPIVEDDDGGFGLNARIVTFLDPGQYYLNVRSFELRAGSVSIGVGAYRPPDVSELAVGAQSTNSTVGLDGARFRFSIENSGVYSVEAQSDVIIPVIEIYQSDDFDAGRILSVVYPESVTPGITKTAIQLAPGQYSLIVYDDFGETGAVQARVVPESDPQ